MCKNISQNLKKSCIIIDILLNSKKSINFGELWNKKF